MKEKLIRDAFKKMDPSQDQKIKLYDIIRSTALEKHEIKNEGNNKKVIVVNHKKKILTTSVAIAACAALTICLGTSIYKNMQDIKISRSGDDDAVTQEVDSTVDKVDPDVTEVSSDTRIDPQSFIYMSNTKYVNGKAYYVGSHGPRDITSYFNVNLLDMTVTPLSESKADFGSCADGNTLYSVKDDYSSQVPVLYVSYINTGQIIQKKDLDDFYHVNTDKNGNIYLSSLDSIKIYSKDLELLYTISNIELSAKINGNTENTEPPYILMNEITVSPEGEIYIGISDKVNNTMNICKLDSEHNIVFTSDNFYNNNMGSSFTKLYLLDNGNLLTCSDNIGVSGIDDDATYIKEISAQTGEIIADHGQLENIFRLYGNCLYGNCLIFDDYVNKYIGKYDINSRETEKVYFYGETDKNSVDNVLLNGDNLTIKLSESYSPGNSDSIYIEDSDGNIIKEISTKYEDTAGYNPIRWYIDNNIFDVTDDEKIYYMTSKYINNNAEDNYEVECWHEVCTIDSDDKPVKLFDLPLSYNDASSPVLSVGSDKSIYICTTDNKGKATLTVYDTSGNIKSTINIPENVSHIFNSILSESELILVGSTSDSNQYCYISIDRNTMQPGEISIIDNDSSTISEDEDAYFSYTNNDIKN